MQNNARHILYVSSGFYELTCLTVVGGNRDYLSWAATDAQPEENGIPRQMKICPKYFTDSQSKRSAADKDYTPGRRGSWCILHPFKLNDFSIGALILIHELTHFDVVGKAAGFPEVQ